VYGPSEPDETAEVVRERFPRTLGEWIAELRLSKLKTVVTRGRRSVGTRGVVRPWARADLAERAFISEVTLYRIETGVELPRFEVLQAIIEALDVPPWQAEVLSNMWVAKAAGPPPRGPLSRDVIRDTLRLLREIQFPALVVDELYFSKARNSFMQHVTGAGERQRRAGLDRQGGFNILLDLFNPAPIPNLNEPSNQIQQATLRRFLLHTARWSTTHEYAQLIDRLDEVLPLWPGWRADVHSGDQRGEVQRPLRYLVEPVGELNFYWFEQRITANRGYRLRVMMPTAQSQAAYDHFRALAADADDLTFIASDWMQP
jgi:transcriptional regulator with XRE-family HTH domain